MYIINLLCIAANVWGVTSWSGDMQGTRTDSVEHGPRRRAGSQSQPAMRSRCQTLVSQLERVTALLQEALWS